MHGEAVGVSDVYVSIGVTDAADEYTAPKPELLAPTATLAQEPSVTTKTRFYSNQPRYITSSEGETKVAVVVSGIRSNRMGTDPTPPAPPVPLEIFSATPNLYTGNITTEFIATSVTSSSATGINILPEAGTVTILSSTYVITGDRHTHTTRYRVNEKGMKTLAVRAKDSAGNLSETAIPYPVAIM